MSQVNKDKLRDDYEDACYNYIAEFGQISEFDFGGWIGYNVGGIALFGDYAIDFLNIVYIVDNDVPVDTFVNWYWFCAEYEQCKINLQNYFKLESDYKAEKIIKTIIKWFNEKAFDESVEPFINEVENILKSIDEKRFKEDKTC